ncbi:MAG: hypothetical protein LBJ08_00055, partial [Bifidobacteriaceae bacterium]|nr:hypothetical protein [Bifidobacteriaceae bacterium]
IVQAVREAQIWRAGETEPAAGEDRAIILGGGATAAAAVAAMAQLGLKGAQAWVRDPNRAAHLMPVAEAAGVDLRIVRLAAGAGVPAAPLVISTLPPGAADPIVALPFGAIGGSVLLDVAYDPWPSPLAVAWSRAGGLVVSGLTMLLHQAAAQVLAMTGRAAPVEAMRAALEAARPGGTAVGRSSRQVGGAPSTPERPQ